MFNTVSKKKISLDIVSEIREAILTGRLKPGDKLPKEADLLAELGVSKHTLREALRALEVLGYLDIRKGAKGGAYVREIGLDTVRESIAGFLHFKDVSIHDLTETRKVVEPYLARNAARVLDREGLEKLAQMNRDCREMLDNGKSISGYRQEINFHRLLARTSGNPVLILILDFVNGLLEESKLNIRPGLDFGEKVLAAHERVLAAIEKRDGDLAAAEMYRHVDEVERELEAIKGGHPADQKSEPEAD